MKIHSKKNICILTLAALIQLFFNIPFAWIILTIFTLTNITDTVLFNPYTLVLFYILGIFFDFLQPLIFGINILSVSIFYLILSILYYLVDLKPSQKQPIKVIILLTSSIFSYLVVYISISIIHITLLDIFLKISVSIFLGWFIIQICKKLN